MSPLSTFGVNAGINTATAGVNAGFGILSSYLANKWARESADHDREENYKFNEKSAEAADARTRALYADLYSPNAQLKQLKEAGLSPSVFYANGAGGISGSAGAQGEGASGVHQSVFGIPNTPISPIDLSQIELNKANARNINAEAQEKERTMEERVDRWFLENKNLKLRNSYMTWDTALKRLEFGIKEEYEPQKWQAEINKITEETHLICEQVRSARVKGDIDEKTEQQQIEMIVNRNKEIIANVALKHAQKRLAEANVELTNEQVEALISKVWQDWKELDIKEDTLNLENERLKAIIEQWNVENGYRKKNFYLNVGKTIMEGVLTEQKMFFETQKEAAKYAALGAI